MTFQGSPPPIPGESGGTKCFSPRFLTEQTRTRHLPRGWGLWCSPSPPDPLPQVPAGLLPSERESPGVPPPLARGEGRAQPDSGKQRPGCPEAGRPQPGQHPRGAEKRDRLSPGALPLYTGELGLRLSGELLLLLPPLSGERRCLPFTLPGSTPPPPAASGGVALGGGGGLPPPRPPPPPPGPVLLPTEAERDRVGLCWLPRRSWYGTVARIGWSSRLVPAETPPAPLPGPPAVPAVGDPAAPRLILCGGGWWWDGGV